MTHAISINYSGHLRIFDKNVNWTVVTTIMLELNIWWWEGYKVLSYWSGVGYPLFVKTSYTSVCLVNLNFYPSSLRPNIAWAHIFAMPKDISFQVVHIVMLIITAILIYLYVKPHFSNFTFSQEMQK